VRLTSAVDGNRVNALRSTPIILLTSLSRQQVTARSPWVAAHGRCALAVQEPGANSEILNTLQYVRPGGGFVPAFPLAAAVSVNGLFSDPLWAYIRASCPSPVDSFIWAPSTWSPVTPRDVAWNFESILFAKSGLPYRRYATAVDPIELAGDIAALLAL